MGHNESNVKRKVHSTKFLHKEAGSSHNIELTEHMKTLQLTEANYTNRTGRQEIIKLREKISKIETKKTT